MGVYEGRGLLSRAMKDLMSHWAAARESWDDVKADEFEKGFLTNLELDVRGATGAMDHLAKVLQQARRDCGE
jgi:hypothetical protein